MFRRDWAAGFQALLDKGVDWGVYDIGDPLEWYVTVPVALFFSQILTIPQSHLSLCFHSLHSAGG